MKVPLALEGLTAEEIELVCDVFRSGNLTMGSRVSNFELEFAQKLKSKYAVMVNSGSSANLLALEVLRHKTRFKNTDELFIAVPAVLWPTSLWPIVQLGFNAVLIDTKPGTLEIDFEQLNLAKEEYGDRLIGAVLIHPLGKSLQLKEIESLKLDPNFFVLEDNCESLGSGNGEKFAGTVGDFGSFSFYYSHHMTTVEGGIITTNNEQYANDLLSMRAHGWTRNRLDKLKIEKDYPHLSTEFLFVSPGYNFRPMEFQGALGSSQLSRLDLFISDRIKNAAILADSLKGSKLSLIGSETLGHVYEPSAIGLPVLNSWMALPIYCEMQSAEVNELRRKVESAGISTRPLLAGDFTAQPAGQNPAIKKFGDLENSRSIYLNSFMVGNHHNFSDAQIEFLSKTLVEVSETL
jgi:CDP-4-dehydro-6-deoxyglucose reductase, E1